MSEKKEVDRILTPEGRLINHSLFTKDQFNDDAVPSYKLEMAFEPDDINDLENALAAAAVEKWGAGADTDYDNGKIISPILDGDKLAKRREEKGKPGDAYKGKLIIRSHTKFNKHGADGPGGIAVFGVNGEEMEAVQSNDLYNGCYGRALVTIGTYTDSRSGDNALMFYLSGFQKMRDDDPLVSAVDYSKVFKPVGRDTSGGDEGGGRRRRAG